MPTYGTGFGYNEKRARARAIHEKLIAKGLDPRSNGYSRAFFKHMRKA